MKKNILIAIVLLAIGIAGFMYFGKSGTETSILISQNSKANSIGADILSALNQLDSLKLDESVFEDASFKTLVNFSRPIQSQPVGRNNPFAPVVKSVSETSAKTTR